MSNRFRKPGWRHIAVATMIALLVPACAVDPYTGAQSIAGIKISDDPCTQTATVAGSAIGAIAGGVIARQVNERNANMALWVASGALLGGIIGHDIDRRRCEIFKIAKKYNMDIAIVPVAVPRGHLLPPGATQAPDGNIAAAQSSAAPQQGVKSDSTVVGLSVVVRNSNQQFAPNSDVLSAQANAYFREVGEQYSYARQAPKLGAGATKEARGGVDSLSTKRILLIGHTDDTGSSSDNANLSERRAMAVAKVFRDQGIADSQLFYQGAGETLPIADNRTEEGRAANRRVEIVDVSDDASFQKYLAMRIPQLEYYRPTSSPGVAAAAVKAAPAQSIPVAAPVDSVQANARTGTAPSGKAKSTRPTTPPAATHAKAPVMASSKGLITQPASAANISGLFDFGGVPASTVTAQADFGKELPAKRSATIIPIVFASGVPALLSCSIDRPRVANGVKSLRSQNEISIAEYMPGLYNSSWTDTVNGNLVGLSHVAVLRDGGSPAAKPNLFIYKGYKRGSGAKPDFSARPEVNTYRGDKAILYRLFVDGPVKCMDVLFPYDNSGEANNANLFYSWQSELYVVSFKPRLAR